MIDRGPRRVTAAEALADLRRLVPLAGGSDVLTAFINQTEALELETRALLREVWRGYDGLGCPGCGAIYEDRRGPDDDDGFDHATTCRLVAALRG